MAWNGVAINRSIDQVQILHLATGAELVGGIGTARAPQIDSGVVWRLALALYHTLRQSNATPIEKNQKKLGIVILILILVRGGLHNTQRCPVSRVCGAVDLHRGRYWTCRAWDLHWYY
jgi:hypothetical protein